MGDEKRFVCKVCYVGFETEDHRKTHYNSVAHRQAYLAQQSLLGFVEFNSKFFGVPYSLFDEELTLNNEYGVWVERSFVLNGGICCLCDTGHLASARVWWLHLDGTGHKEEIEQLINDEGFENTVQNFGHMMASDKIQTKYVPRKDEGPQQPEGLTTARQNSGKWQAPRHDNSSKFQRTGQFSRGGMNTRDYSPRQSDFQSRYDSNYRGGRDRQFSEPKERTISKEHPPKTLTSPSPISPNAQTYGQQKPHQSGPPQNLVSNSPNAQQHSKFLSGGPQEPTVRSGGNQASKLKELAQKMAKTNEGLSCNQQLMGLLEALMEEKHPDHAIVLQQLLDANEMAKLKQSVQKSLGDISETECLEIALELMAGGYLQDILRERLIRAKRPSKVLHQSGDGSSGQAPRPVGLLGDSPSDPRFSTRGSTDGFPQRHPPAQPKNSEVLSLLDMPLQKPPGANGNLTHDQASNTLQADEQVAQIPQCSPQKEGRMGFKQEPGAEMSYAQDIFLDAPCHQPQVYNSQVHNYGNEVRHPTPQGPNMGRPPPMGPVMRQPGPRGPGIRHPGPLDPNIQQNGIRGTAMHLPGQQGADMRPPAAQALVRPHPITPQSPDMRLPGPQGLAIRHPGPQGLSMPPPDLQGPGIRPAGLQGSIIRHPGGPQVPVVRPPGPQGPGMRHLGPQGPSMHPPAPPGPEMSTSGPQGSSIRLPAPQGSGMCPPGPQGPGMRPLGSQGPGMRPPAPPGPEMHASGPQGSRIRFPAHQGPDMRFSGQQTSSKRHPSPQAQPGMHPPGSQGPVMRHSVGPQRPDICPPGPQGPGIRHLGSQGPEMRPPGPQGPGIRHLGSQGPEMRPPGPQGPGLHRLGPQGPDLRASGPQGLGMRYRAPQEPTMRHPGPRGPEMRPIGPRGPDVRPSLLPNPDFHHPYPQGDRMRQPGPNHTEVHHSGPPGPELRYLAPRGPEMRPPAPRGPQMHSQEREWRHPGPQGANINQNPRGPEFHHNGLPGPKSQESSSPAQGYSEYHQPRPYDSENSRYSDDYKRQERSYDRDLPTDDRSGPFRRRDRSSSRDRDRRRDYDRRSDQSRNRDRYTDRSRDGSPHRHPDSRGERNRSREGHRSRERRSSRERHRSRERRRSREDRRERTERNPDNQHSSGPQEATPNTDFLSAVSQALNNCNQSDLIKATKAVNMLHFTADLTTYLTSFPQAELITRVLTADRSVINTLREMRHGTPDQINQLANFMATL